MPSRVFEEANRDVAQAEELEQPGFRHRPRCKPDPDLYPLDLDHRLYRFCSCGPCNAVRARLWSTADRVNGTARAPLPAAVVASV